MKIVSEQQLKYIKSKFEDLMVKRVNEYVFEGQSLSFFENLILFYDDTLFDTIRKEHYLSMTACQRIWNKYFWHLRYRSNISKNGGNTGNHIQPIAKVVEELYNNCGTKINDLDIEPFYNFATYFDSQEYIMFDYFHPAITDTGVSIKSNELDNIIKSLGITEIGFDEIDYYIENNIDNPNAEILTYRNRNDKNIFFSIDTFSASEDQIHPIEMLISCKFSDMESIDKELVKWWSKFWRKMGPFVAISTINKFEREKYFEKRVRIEK